MNLTHFVTRMRAPLGKRRPVFYAANIFANELGGTGYHQVV